MSELKDFLVQVRPTTTFRTCSCGAEEHHHDHAQAVLMPRVIGKNDATQVPRKLMEDDARTKAMSDAFGELKL